MIARSESPTFSETLAEAYAAEGRAAGLTIAEWERAVGLPPFSVCPEARTAASMCDPGFFMYRNATDEERRILDAESGGATGRSSLRALAEIRAAKEKERARHRARYHAKKEARA